MSKELNKKTLFTGEIWHTPSKSADPRPGVLLDAVLEVWPSGGLLVGADGRIIEVGDATSLTSRHPDATVISFGDQLILPGFIDAHLHFPQLDMIGSYGKQLLGWLDEYTYPHERRFANDMHARDVASRFFDELLANSITTSAIYSSSHRSSTDLLFAEAERRGTRAIIGKVSMDRMAPPELLHQHDIDSLDNEALISRWHGRDKRLFVALTPRFAISCSEAMLSSLGALYQRYPDLYVQTHHAETRAEVAEVSRLFPLAPHYAGVYDRFGLLGPRTILGHCIYASEAELELFVERGVAVAHCPTSNLFLGSGMFPLQGFSDRGIRIALASDIGAGTSLSMLQTMNEAYKIQQLQGRSLSPAALLYLATQGGADALCLGAETGSFEQGKSADFQVLDWRRKHLLKTRFEDSRSPSERLFSLIMLGDDRLTHRVYTRGRCLHVAPALTTSST